MERQNAAVSQMDANLAEMEDEFLQDQAVTYKLVGTKDDPLMREDFYSEREMDSLRVVDSLFYEVEQWLQDHSYDIENHFSVFDWLNIYGESVTMGFDNRMMDINGDGKKLSNEDWQRQGSLAKFISDYKSKANVYQERSRRELPEFLASQSDLPDSASQSSLW